MVERTDLQDIQDGVVGIIRGLKAVLIQVLVVGPFLAAAAVFLLVSFALPGSRGVGEIPYQVMIGIESAVPGELGVKQCLDEPASTFPPAAAAPCVSTAVEQVPIDAHADAVGRFIGLLYLLGILVGAALWAVWRGFVWSLSFMLPWHARNPRHSA
ncbi:hypothetical protein [Stutzerimonas kunmingensis]|uniref:hypothetical protein n=1 Tax=Stutzerimonas kunmingensis TaxID=1211807 RepID=UPI0028A691AC|nr:hypothetical protein [Stutzerimonas kunmingensis]